MGEEEEEKPDPRTLKLDLYEAAVANDTAKIVELLSLGVPCTYIDTFSSWTPLHWACMHGNVTAVKKLLECGASGPYKRAFERQVKEKMFEIMQAKKENLGSVALPTSSNEGENNENNVNENGETVVDENSTEIERLDDTSNIESITEVKKSAPLVEQVVIVEEEDDEFIRQERRLEATVSFHKNTPLLWAAIKGHVTIIWLLLKEGFNPNDVDNTGNNAVHLAAANNHLAALKVLIDDGGSANAVNMYRNAPIHLSTTKPIRELLYRAMESNASMTEEERKLKHENNVSLFMSSTSNLEKIVADSESAWTENTDSSELFVVIDNLMKTLPEIIRMSKEMCLEDDLVKKAEKNLEKFECSQELLAEVKDLTAITPIQTQSQYISYVTKLESTVTKAETVGVNDLIVSIGRDLIRRCQVEYWLVAMTSRLKDVECATAAYEQDMKKLLSAIQKSRVLRMTGPMVDDCFALYERLKAELGMSVALSKFPVVKLPMDNPPEGYYSAADIGKLKDDYAEFPSPPPDNNGEYNWEPAANFTQLSKAIEELKVCYASASKFNANEKITTESKEKLAKAEKEFKLLDAKNSADKANAIDTAHKLLKKSKGGKKAKK